MILTRKVIQVYDRTTNSYVTLNSESDLIRIAPGENIDLIIKNYLFVYTEPSSSTQPNAFLIAYQIQNDCYAQNSTVQIRIDSDVSGFEVGDEVVFVILSNGVNAYRARITSINNNIFTFFILQRSAGLNICPEELVFYMFKVSYNYNQQKPALCGLFRSYDNYNDFISPLSGEEFQLEHPDAIIPNFNDKGRNGLIVNLLSTDSTFQNMIQNAAQNNLGISNITRENEFEAIISAGHIYSYQDAFSVQSQVIVPNVVFPLDENIFTFIINFSSNELADATKVTLNNIRFMNYNRYDDLLEFQSNLPVLTKQFIFNTYDISYTIPAGHTELYRFIFTFGNYSQHRSSINTNVRNSVELLNTLYLPPGTSSNINYNILPANRTLPLFVCAGICLRRSSDNKLVYVYSNPVKIEKETKKLYSADDIKNTEAAGYEAELYRYDDAVWAIPKEDLDITKYYFTYATARTYIHINNTPFLVKTETFYIEPQPGSAPQVIRVPNPYAIYYSSLRNYSFRKEQLYQYKAYDLSNTIKNSYCDNNLEHKYYIFYISIPSANTSINTAFFSENFLALDNFDISVELEFTDVVFRSEPTRLIRANDVDNNIVSIIQDDEDKIVFEAEIKNDRELSFCIEVREKIDEGKPLSYFAYAQSKIYDVCVLSFYNIAIFNNFSSLYLFYTYLEFIDKVNDFIQYDINIFNYTIENNKITVFLNKKNIPVLDFCVFIRAATRGLVTSQILNEAKYYCYYRDIDISTPKKEICFEKQIPILPNEQIQIVTNKSKTLYSNCDSIIITDDSPAQQDKFKQNNINYNSSTCFDIQPLGCRYMVVDKIDDYYIDFILHFTEKQYVNNLLNLKRRRHFHRLISELKAADYTVETEYYIRKNYTKDEIYRKMKRRYIARLFIYTSCDLYFLSLLELCDYVSVKQRSNINLPSDFEKLFINDIKITDNKKFMIAEITLEDDKEFVNLRY